MKLVAVSQRVVLEPNYNEMRDALDQKICLFLIEAGYLPLPVPNIMTKKNNQRQSNKIFLEKWLLSTKPDAIVLSGGNDLGEYFKRDLTEKYLLEYAKKKNLSLLGICRGMQMMTVWLGGTLQKVNNHVAKNHKIIGSINRTVNSYHNYSILECPSELIVLARSLDNNIEAIKHFSMPWEGWMWHPERNKKFNDFDLKRIRNLFG